MTLSGTEERTLLLQKDETLQVHLSLLLLPHRWTVLIFCVGDKQKISRVLSTALHTLSTLEWEVSAVTWVLCHWKKMEHLGWNLSSTELLDLCVFQGLSYNVLSGNDPGFICYRALNMLLNFACLIPGHFWRHKQSWQMCCPGGRKEGEPGIYWCSSGSWRLCFVTAVLT